MHDDLGGSEVLRGEFSASCLYQLSSLQSGPRGPADLVLILQGVWKGTCGFSFMEVTECQREEVNALERRIYYLHHLREGGTPHHAGHRATTSVGQEAERSQRKAWTGTLLGLPREAQCRAGLSNVGGLWGSL